jgi:hypothetical protein
MYGSGGVLPPFLTFALGEDEGEWLVAFPGHYIPGQIAASTHLFRSGLGLRVSLDAVQKKNPALLKIELGPSNP